MVVVMLVGRPLPLPGWWGHQCLMLLELGLVILAR